MNMVLWISAAALGALALLVAAWALLADRSRGRRRCPKCFHPMDAKIGLICPECGHDTRDERRLFHTRRRWKLAIAGVVVLGGMGLGCAGIAHVQRTGGWADLPTWTLARLTWLRDDKLDEEILLRVGRGQVTAGQAGHLVTDARRRLASSTAEDVDSGLALLNRFARNDVGYYPDFAKVRPRLEELNPHALARDLMDLEATDPARLRDVANLLGHLRDVSDEAVLWLLARGVDDRMRTLPDIWSALKTTINRPEPGQSPRLPRPPDVLGVGAREMPSRGVDRMAVATTTTLAVREARSDAAAVRDWARKSWEETLSDASIQVDTRLPQLWLWCRLDHFGPESYPTALAAAQHDDPAVRAYAVTLLAGYAWSEQTASVLRAQLASDSEEVASASLETARSFKSEAPELLPDILARVASPEGVWADGDFIGAVKAMGGSEDDLRDAIVQRLETVYETRLDSVALESRPTARTPIILDDDFRRLAYFTNKSERAAAICMKYTGVGEHMPSGGAAVAYAAMSGDRTWATRFMLDKTPKLTDGYTFGTTTQALLELVLAGQADAMLLSEHFKAADPTERAAFTQMLEGFVGDWKTLEPFVPYLRTIHDNASNPTEQASSKAALDRYEKYKAQDDNQ